MNVLFICNQNQHRSRTAELLFREKFNTKSAGLYDRTPVTREELSWADLVLVMEPAQRSEIAKRFPDMYLKKRILSLDIPDIYQFNQPELIKVLKSRLKRVLPS